MFRLLGFENNHEWLTQLPAEWSKYQEYIEMNDVVLTLEVVNDNAEREIKNMQEEYAMSSLDGELRQNIVIVSNSHRAKITQITKYYAEFFWVSFLDDLYMEKKVGLKNSKKAQKRITPLSIPLAS